MMKFCVGHICKTDDERLKKDCLYERAEY